MVDHHFPEKVDPHGDELDESSSEPKWDAAALYPIYIPI